ncbi:TetR/AcrR family transcriptional regulator [Microbacterium sp. C7(2022)]|uniref:TetR/AcrR family transcriptional regulator n=1 Tax=Microbacterium sp. C7(2022) TaxID=2992759 RepID=UPI00237BA759|nr:TetR/AcrR family transcriptional regulator [Microbacterium sp. C7(2022)]MDE0545134.1 TetR family transcriptional regulator [Microbacterium sp. C7(2022)]
MSVRDTKTTRAIAVSAVKLFTRDGFAATSVRAIAADAGVDPALVIRHFGTKVDLFLETMRWELDADALFAGPLDELGHAIVTRLLQTDGSESGVFLALLRASDAGAIGTSLTRAHEEGFVAPLRRRLAGEDADLRARLAAGLVGGLFYMLWVVGDTAAAADPEALARRYGALLQELITPL